MPSNTETTYLAGATVLQVRCRDTWCSVPGCSNFAAEPGEFTCCAEDHAHVWEVRYRDLNDYLTWTRVRATSKRDAIDLARARITERVPAFRTRFEVVEAVKVV